MNIGEIKKWVESNVWHYEPEWDDYDIDQATNDMLYNFFRQELNMKVDPHDGDNYEWEHKEFLINEFKKVWDDWYN
jgi:hypothetical protein